MHRASKPSLRTAPLAYLCRHTATLLLPTASAFWTSLLLLVWFGQNCEPHGSNAFHLYLLRNAHYPADFFVPEDAHAHRSSYSTATYNTSNQRFICGYPFLFLRMTLDYARCLPALYVLVRRCAWTGKIVRDAYRTRGHYAPAKHLYFICAA